LIEGARRATTAAVLGLVLSCGLPAAHAQVPPVGEAPAGPTARAEANAEERPGLFHAGPFYLTPRLRIGTIGIDTNVFYTPTDRQTDFTATGGPGLEIVLPIRSSVRLSTEGGVDYVYFLKTDSQRRWQGDAKARLDAIGQRAALGLEAGYRRTFSRPSFEVDERIVQVQKQARLEGHVELAERFDLRADALGTRLEVPEPAEFGGADLQRTLTHDTYLGRLTLACGLTAKTSLLVVGDYEGDQFPLEPGRDADSNRAGIGFEVLSQTRLSGKAVGGVRSFRLRSPDRPETTDVLVPWADVNLTYEFGPRTRLLATYNRDLYYSAFEPVTGLPMVHMETYRLHLQKGLVGALDVKLFGGLTKITSDGLVRVEVDPGETVVARRDDDAWEGGADLGYTFKGHLRIGASASYTERRSTIDDFGIDGLLVGGTITFTP
jgi:hypothetical protein